MKAKLLNKLNLYFHNHLSVIKQSHKILSPTIVEITKIISTRIKKKNKILICGNGGSASDSQHIATEFMSSLTHDVKREAIPAIALTTDTSFLTAFTNDFEYKNIFSRQIEGLGNKNDILICLSTSGNSPNILNALQTAKDLNMTTMLFTGKKFNYNAKADLVLNVPSVNTQHIQETHITLAHIIIELVEIKLGYRN